MKKLLLILVFLAVSTGYAYAQTTALGNRGSISQITCDTSTTAIDGRDSLRVSFIIQNTDTTNPTFICFTVSATTACTTTTGVRLDAGTSTGKNALTSNPMEYIGPLSCITTGAATTIIFSEVLK